MTIKSSGSSLAISEIAAEFGGSTPHSMSEYYSGGDNVPSSTGDIASSGANSMSNFYGTSNRIIITLTISGDTNNYNIFSNKGGTYSAGISDVTLVNNARISSSSTGTAAVDTGSGWANGDTITIDNNSTIVGDGGNGGAGSSSIGGGSAGSAAGHAVNVQFNTTVDNTGGTISGGGGGGGGGLGTQTTSQGKGGQVSTLHGGGGGGGGFGGGAGGAGGTPTSGNNNNNGNAGAAGSVSAAGAGGSAITSGNAGGAGGAVATAGTQGGGSGGTGGAAGKAINLNGNTVTFTATGTRNGATS